MEATILLCLIELSLIANLVMGNIVLSQITMLKSSEVLQDVDYLGIISRDDSNDDVNNDHLIETFSNFDRLRTSIWENPFCDGDYGKIWLFIDASGKSEFLTKASRSSFGTCKWLFAKSEHNVNILNKLRPAYNSLIYLWDQEANDKIVTTTISEIYTPTNISRIFENVVVKYQNGKQTGNFDTIWRRRKDLDGIRLRMTLFPTGSGLVTPRGDASKSFGFQIEVLKDMQKTFNFTYQLMLPKSGTYGVTDKNGTWNGMMKQLLDNEADISLILQVTSQRGDLVDFYHVLCTTDLTLVVKRTDLSTKFSFIEMLAIPVWISGACCIAVFLAYAAFNDLMRRKKGNRKERGHVVGVFFVIYSALINQGLEDRSKQLSIRILILTVLFFGFLGLNFLSANLTSSISVKIEADDIRGLEDVEAKNMELFIWGNSSMEADFATSIPGSVKKRLWDKQISKNQKFRPNTFQGSMRNFLESEKGALLTYVDLIKPWMASSIEAKRIGCGLKMIKMNQGKTLLAFGSKKGFPYFEAFNEQIGKMVENGMQRKYYADWIANLDTSQEYLCSSVEEDPDIALGLDETRFFYFLLMVGICLGILIAIWEFLAARCGKTQLQEEIEGRKRVFSPRKPENGTTRFFYPK